MKKVSLLLPTSIAAVNNICTVSISLNLFELNPPQREAVLHDAGPMLVLAGAGSGKTRVIIYRIARLMLDGVPPERILAVTFTNKAAQEMRARLTSLVGKPGRAVTLSTFHALGLNILKEEHVAAGLGSNFAIYDTADQLSLTRELMRQVQVADRRLDAQRVLDIMLATKRRGDDEVRLDWGDDYELAALDLYPRYLEQMRAFGAIDFDDLILRSNQVLRQPEVAKRWAGRYHFLLVDEFQDTSPDQIELLKALCQGQHNITAVGDDDQAIYGWRGAAVDNILSFAKHFPNTKEVVLDQNYRSTCHILNAANAVIAQNTARRPKTLWSALGQGEPVTIMACATDEAESTWVTQSIEALRYEGVPLGDIAVLYRANAQSRPIEEELLASRIPVRVLGGQALFDRKEVRDGMAFLQLLHNGDDEVALRRIINVPPRGIGPASLERLAHFAKTHGVSLGSVLSRAHEVPNLPAAAVTGARDLSAQLATSRQQVRHAPRGKAAEQVSALFDALALRDAILSANDAAAVCTRRLENLSAAISALERFERKHDDAAERANGILGPFLRAAALRHDQPEEQSQGEVTLMTLHAAKGLEFPYVFMVGVEEEYLPHRRAMDDTGPEAAQSLSEERRLCYVGMTRARRQLFLSHAKTRLRHGRHVERTPSRFLDDLPQGEGIVRKSYGSENDGPEDAARSEALAQSFFAKMRAQLGIDPPS